MKNRNLIFVLAAWLSIACGLRTAVADELKSGFLQPPKQARPSIYYLLLNGYVNRDHLDRELEQYAAAGVSGLCVFDMGAKGPEGTIPPDGPVFMSDQWIDNFAHILRKAGDLGMDVQLAVSSSWDMGASWVRPEQASKALYHSSLEVTGPAELDLVLPFPKVSAKTPKNDQGLPVHYSEIATLAVPQGQKQSVHEFIFELPPLNHERIDRVVLYNTESGDAGKYGPKHLFAKDFSVSVSQTDTAQSSFKQVIRATLEPKTGPQQFDLEPVTAAYARLRIYSGHNEDFEQVQLGEFELYTEAQVNVAASHVADRTRQAARLLGFSSEAGGDGKWTAHNIHDGEESGPSGSWASAEQLPSIVKDPHAVIELTDKLDSGGRLRWKVPKGEWTVLRFICANTGEKLKVPSPASNGLATDHFSAQATEQYIAYLTDRLQQHIGDISKTSLEQLYLPSYEVRGSLWTEDLIEQFARYRGYDPTPYLPTLMGYVIGSREQTDRFKYDFDKTMGDLLVDAYYRTASETANRVGLGIEAESGGPGPPVHQVPVDALEALGAIDEMRGEWWPWRPDSAQLWVVKETACAAHIYGRRRVHMESFTGFRHWQAGPFDLKPSADRAFCEGMNHVVWHTASHQPPEAGKPGWVYGAGTHLTPNRIWWPMAKAFLDYLSRCSYMLQQGLFVADVCYYYGDQGYNFVPPKHIDPSLGYGYDYDVTNPEVILNRMSVKNGRITLPDGMQYEMLVLPDRRDIDLEVLRKIAELVKAGATVVGPRPMRSNGLKDYEKRNRQVRSLAATLWDKCDGKNIRENKYGRGKIIWGRTLRQILLERGKGPDFSYEGCRTDPDIDFIHRRTADAEIYFIRNKTEKQRTINASFRVTHKAPRLWLPQTGQTRQLHLYEQTKTDTRIPLELPPFGSVFVVFRGPSRRLHATSADPDLAVDEIGGARAEITVFANASHRIRTSDNRIARITTDEIPAPLEIAGDWTVRFDAEMGTPHSVKMSNLTSWTEHRIEAIRYFSGIAEYRIQFDIPRDRLGKARRLYLDLGRLWAVGKVTLNGKSLGVVWNPPYRIEITDVAKPGKNDLQIAVANTWSNRLVGDARSPENQRYCRTNITGSGTRRKLWKDIELHESGLLGPVKLISAIRKTVNLNQ